MVISTARFVISTAVERSRVHPIVGGIEISPLRFAPVEMIC